MLEQLSTEELVHKVMAERQCSLEDAVSLLMELTKPTDSSLK
ncbi:hypothetical protein [Ligilactobacillus equi]|nr:hypothetical protein [Ligilactobacillus equi]